MITKFKITERTKRTFLKIQNVLAVVGTEYDIALQSQITIENILGYRAEPLDQFKYKVIIDGVASVNEGTVLVNFETDKTTSPSVLNLNETLAINYSLFFSNLVYAESNYDRIVITEISGKGSWLLNSTTLVVGDTIFFYDLIGKLIFYANQQGSKEAYNILKWKSANVLQTFQQENQLIINTSSLGVLLNLSGNPVLENFLTYKSYETFLNIENGADNGSYELVVDTTYFPNIGIDSENEVTLIVDEVPTTYKTSGIFILNGTLTSSGNKNVKVIINQKLSSTEPVIIKVTLSAINELLSTVDASNSSQSINTLTTN
jgi:hypothetical protein